MKPDTILLICVIVAFLFILFCYAYVSKTAFDLGVV